MFGLSESQYNAVKRVCRACNSEIREKLGKIEPKKRAAHFNSISKVCIDKHHGQLMPILTRIQFIWLCGYLEGQFGQSFDYE